MNYQIAFLNKPSGIIEVCDIEKINKYTKIIEPNDKRFSLQGIILNGSKKCIEFIYQKKLYISLNNAKETFNDFTK